MWKCLLAVLVAGVLGGCSQAMLVQPVGRPLAAEEQLGVWRTTDATQVRVTAGGAPGEVVIEELGKTKPELVPGRLTTVGDGVTLLWVYEPEQTAYAVVRFVQREDGAVVFPPDFAQLKRWLEAGTLRGRKLEDQDTWLLEPAGVEALLASPAFWDLARAAPLLKQPPAP